MTSHLTLKKYIAGMVRVSTALQHAFKRRITFLSEINGEQVYDSLRVMYSTQ